MTKFVIDANVLMGILISGKASYRTILTFYDFVLPDFALVEIDKYHHVLGQNTKFSDEQFFAWSCFVFSQLTILPRYIIQQNVLKKSSELLKSIDSKDTAYVALGMQLDLILLTRDKPLFAGFKKQGFRRVLLFEDFLRNI